MVSRFNRLSFYLNKEKGFSLAELLVVVVIIAILVAIAIPIYTTLHIKAQEKTCKANQRIIEGTVNMWLEADISHRVEDVTMADLKQFWVNDPEPFCPLGVDHYTFDENGHVICPYGHEHY